jgi:hypothetical protein
VWPARARGRGFRRRVEIRTLSDGPRAPIGWHSDCRYRAGGDLDMPLVLIVVLVVLALGAIPAWPYGRDWGYYPSSALTVALLILLAVVPTGRL